MSRSTTRRPAGATRRRAPFQLVVVHGAVHGPVVAGTAADGSSLLSFDVVVDGADGRSLVPVSVRDHDAVALADGEPIVVRGRVAKRFHRAGGRVVARTALEAEELVVSPSRAVLGRVVARAGAAVDEADAAAR